MNFDKNTVIGFVILMVLLFGYIFFTQQQQATLMKEKQRTADSLARIEQLKKKVQDTVVLQQKTPVQDTLLQAVHPGSFTVNNTIPEQLTVVENDLMKVTFTNKGGYPKTVELKKYKRYDGKPVVLGGEGHQLIYAVNTSDNQSAQTSQLHFSGGQIVTDGEFQILSYKLSDTTSGRLIEHRFKIRKNEYLIEWDVVFDGADRLLTQGLLNLNWDIVTHKQEQDLKYEKGQSNIGYFEDGNYDFSAAGNGDDIKLGDKTQWLGVKQQFFNTSLIAGSKYAAVESAWTVPESDSLNHVMEVKSSLKFSVTGLRQATIPLKLFYGPNDYHTLKRYNLGLENHVQLGYGIFAFVKYINRFIIMPVFDFFHQHMTSIGIVILLLTFFIRLVISPLTYSSYLSGAKMKVLKPEIEELKKKYGTDQQAMSMEQMKLFRQAGVNPLGGCIPALLQIPIFFALYSFFNANIDLRGESFLWASNLASYDSIAKLPFSIPGYGNHVSLFTLTATLTSLLISIYNTQMTPQQDNPVFKYMIYFFPIMLLFIFNSLPSALTWYYTVSNIVTLVLQFVIQKFIINEDKIHAKIQENKKKPVTKSKWQEKMEQMQQSNQRLQELQKKTTPKK